MSGCRTAHLRTRKPPGHAKLIGAAVLLAGLLSAVPAYARTHSIETRPGLTIDVLTDVPEGASVLVLLFEGGHGLLLPGSKGFAHKAYPILLRQGVAAALMDAPRDRDGFRGGLDPGFRESSTHLSDIDAVVTALKFYYGLPVWVLGTSNGTRSAAAYALQYGNALAGVILASSSTDPPFGDPIQILAGIEAVSVPLLTIAHLGVRCVGSPPGGAALIANAATGSSAAVAMLFTGGLDTGIAACGAESHHAFYGIEVDVVSTVVDFVIRHTTRQGHLETAQPE
jgi:hypothetical protein